MDTTRHPRIERDESLAEFWGRSLRARRTALGLSQTQLAYLAGMTQQAVWQFETGKRIPLDRTKVALAQALGTTPAELFPWPPMEDLGGAA